MEMVMGKKSFVSAAVIAVVFLFFFISSVAAAAQRGKAASSDLVPDELKSLKVEDYFIEGNGSPVGSIQNASGYVIVFHKDTGRAYFAAAGDAVYRKDIFYTLNDSRCRIRFSTEDIITMGENSKIVADEVTDDRASGEKKSSVSMLKGKAMFYVVRLFKYKKVSAVVNTPAAVMGVRGTKFGVEVRKVSEKVADISDRSFVYLAQNDSANSETIVYGFEGSVDVTSNIDGNTQTVGEGQTLVLDNTGSGNIEQTDPGAANQFIGETEGGGGGGASGGSGSGSGGSESGTGGSGEEGGGTGDTGGTEGSSAENIAQNVTGSSIDQQGQSSTTDAWPVNRMGYFTAMLTFYDGESKSHSGTFMSSELQDFTNPGDPAYGNDAYDPDDNEMWVNRNSSKLTKINSDNYVDGEYPVIFTNLGHNAYMEWGYWTMTDSVDIGDGMYYHVDNRGYYITGDNTSDIDMANLQSIEGWWLYSGGADGTYWTDGGGVNMTGGFDAKVNFNSQSILEFNMTVTGEGHMASVTGASGSFEGTSHFILDLTSSGTAAIDENDGDFKASGSFYGPAAQSMGGAWRVETEGSNATGIFHGDKKGATDPPFSIL
jgi:hypothetical protein